MPASMAVVAVPVWTEARRSRMYLPCISKEKNTVGTPGLLAATLIRNHVFPTPVRASMIITCPGAMPPCVRSSKKR